jgi:DNA primase
MNTLTDWINFELYPTLFNHVERFFPEHNFSWYSNGWRSNTYLSGIKHHRADKTIISKNAPYCILEQGGDCKSIINYLMERDHRDFYSTIKYLSESLGLKIPSFDQNDTDSYFSFQQKQNILEILNSYFVYLLNEEKSDDLVKNNILAYLTNERGYSPEEIKAMGLGYTPSYDRILNYIRQHNISEEELNSALNFKTDGRIGSSHILSIPYRTGNTIRGFKFRSIGNHLPKYINSSGLDKIAAFFNISALKSDKDITIVEGELDCLHASAKGLDNIVSIGGSSINSNQIKDAIKRGAKRFTICFDSEPLQNQELVKKVNRAIEVIRGEQVNNVYLVTLPNNSKIKVDPDSFIRTNGIEAFENLIKHAKPYYVYQLNAILNKYYEIQQELGILTPKDLDALLDEIIEKAIKIDQPIHKQIFLKKFLSHGHISELGITEASIFETMDRLSLLKDREAQSREFKKLILEITSYHEKGDIDKAISHVNKKINEIKLKDKNTEFANLIIPINEEIIRQNQSQKPISLNSGYTIEDEAILLPSGAISIIAAPTSHGKTSFLINLALNVVNQYPNKEVAFFSYEEDRDNILIQALNVYINEKMSHNNRRSIQSYFANGTIDYIKTNDRDTFRIKKDEFFKDIISTRRLNINYSSYDSDTLIDAIRYLNKNTNLGAVFIDYIQLLNLPDGKYKTYSRQEEIKEICIALKDLAIETGLPIILGAQFNRDVVNQLKLFPHKIGEAGDIERIANLIIGFWNNNFDPEIEGKDKLEIDKLKKKNHLFTVVLKNRGGKVGMKENLEFNGNTGKIANSTVNNPF